MDLYFITDVTELNNCAPKPYDKLSPCFADYSNQCSNDMPYICTEGLVKGACTSDPNIWQGSRMCKRFCDVRNPPDTHIVQPYPLYIGIRKPEVRPNYDSYLPTPNVSKEVPCMSNTICHHNAPYQCLTGPAFGGCSDNAQLWENDPNCHTYCDIRTKPRSCPSMESFTLSPKAQVKPFGFRPHVEAPPNTYIKIQNK